MFVGRRDVYAGLVPKGLLFLGGILGGGKSQSIPSVPTLKVACFSCESSAPLFGGPLAHFYWGRGAVLIKYQPEKPPGAPEHFPVNLCAKELQAQQSNGDSWHGSHPLYVCCIILPANPSRRGVWV